MYSINPVVLLLICVDRTLISVMKLKPVPYSNSLHVLNLFPV